MSLKRSVGIYFLLHWSYIESHLLKLNNGIGGIMALAIYIGYYLVAITTLFFHFTGHLERWGMEWVILVLAATVFPVVLYV
ncbi:MAG: hypothetical protein CTY32_03800 [Methylotenera sp.]|nr:MAG: hypothetical protein CTY32_03800 [Methylotenera sp.]